MIISVENERGCKQGEANSIQQEICDINFLSWVYAVVNFTYSINYMLIYLHMYNAFYSKNLK